MISYRKQNVTYITMNTTKKHIKKMKTIIKSNGHRYLGQMPEFAEGLPFGILNKKRTDAGGSFTAINCKDVNYIVVVPFKDLADSLAADKNCQYSVQKVYGGISYNDVKDYLTSNEVHKFVVVYDSLPKLITWIERNGFDTKNYKILVDEFHLLLEDLGYREKAINNLMKYIGKFDHYTYMSATPTNDTFLTDMFKELPYTEIEWDNCKTIKPTRIKTPNVYAATVKLINSLLDDTLILPNNQNIPTKVEELYIFLNSVVGIKQIIESVGLENDDVKVVCADNIRNKYVMNDIEISNVTSPNKRINFFTKKSFQGTNLFSNNGLIVAISDGRKANTLIDVETTLYQLAGRLRVNEQFNNVFSNIIWHIYSNRKNVQSVEEFESHLNKNIREANTVISTYNKLNTEEREVYSKRMTIDDLVCYYDEIDDKFVYSELKEKHFRFNYTVVNHIYANGLNIREAYIKSGLDSGTQNWTGKLEDVVVKKITKVGFRELLEEYISLRETGQDEIAATFEAEHPLFKQAYDKLGASGIKTCGYVEKEIKERLYAKDDSVLEVVYRNFFKKIGDGNFISNKEAKAILIDIFKLFKITSVKPTTTMLKNCRWFEVESKAKKVNGEVINGVIIKSIK